MSPKIVFAALLFCCVLLGFGYAGILLRRPSDDSYTSYQSTPNYPSDRYSLSYPSNNILPNPGMSGSFGGLGQNSAVWGPSWNWHQQLGLGGQQSGVLGSQSLGSYPQSGYTYRYEYQIPSTSASGSC